MDKYNKHNRELVLDQLQTMFNAVLEQTANVFIASNGTEGHLKDRATVAAARFRAIIPPASNNFHDSLDQLENELYIARQVLTRDLEAIRQQKITRMRRQSSSSSKNDQDKSTIVRDGDTEMIDASSILPPAITPIEITLFSEAQQNILTQEGGNADIPVDLDITDDHKPLVIDLQLDPSPDIFQSNEPNIEPTLQPIESIQTTGTGTVDSPSTPNIQTTSIDIVASNNKDSSQIPQQHTDYDPDDLTSLLTGLESYANAEVNDPVIDLKVNDKILDDIQDKQKTNEEPNMAVVEKKKADEKPLLEGMIDFDKFDFGAFANVDVEDMGDLETENGEGQAQTFDESFWELE